MDRCCSGCCGKSAASTNHAKISYDIYLIAENGLTNHNLNSSFSLSGSSPHQTNKSNHREAEVWPKWGSPKQLPSSNIHCLILSLTPFWLWTQIPELSVQKDSVYRPSYSNNSDITRPLLASLHLFGLFPSRKLIAGDFTALKFMILFVGPNKPTWPHPGSARWRRDSACNHARKASWYIFDLVFTHSVLNVKALVQNPCLGATIRWEPIASLFLANPFYLCALFLLLPLINYRFDGTNSVTLSESFDWRSFFCRLNRGVRQTIFSLNVFLQITTCPRATISHKIKKLSKLHLKNWNIQKIYKNAGDFPFLMQTDRLQKIS